MITKNLRINQLSEKAFEKMLKYWSALDEKDVSKYGTFLANDITVQFNNDKPMVGKETVLQGLDYYWQTFGTLEHDLTNIYGNDSHFVLEARNYYVRKDGNPATVNSVAFTDMNDEGLVASVRIYQDVSPVFS